jgi:hypothetical protein
MEIRIRWSYPPKKLSPELLPESTRGATSTRPPCGTEEASMVTSGFMGATNGGGLPEFQTSVH